MNFSRRVTQTQPYLFHETDKKRKSAKEKGVDVISLDIGDPDRPTPDFVLRLMEEELQKPANHRYPSYEGEPDFRAAVSEWFGNRFGVGLDPGSEIMATIGAKDAVSHLPLAFVDPGDCALVTDPGYPVYETAVRFAGGRTIWVPLSEKNGFLPDLESIDPAQADRAKIMFVNYPNNPTSAVADESFFERLVAFARAHDLVILADNAYSEVYFNEADKPVSIFQIPGAKETAIEIHSFSKTFNMTGWRIGFVAGSKELIKAFLTLKSNFDSGVFMAIQRTAARALKHPEAPGFARERTNLFRNRRDLIAAALSDAGFRFELPRASYYFWVRIPDAYTSSVKFCADLLEKAGISVVPGVGYGPNGEHYFRISMTTPDTRIDEAMQRMKIFAKARA